MKSIQNQYIDLKEGRMSQANFMRNVRMTLPQYVTNVTSFKDAVRILKNKAILNENLGAKEEEDEEFIDMIAKAEEEEAGKYTKFDDYEGGLSEALNKDIKAFGQDLDKRFKEAGFDTLVLILLITSSYFSRAYAFTLSKNASCNSCSCKSLFSMLNSIIYSLT